MLFFPPPTRFLAARPPKKRAEAEADGGAPPPANVNESEAAPLPVDPADEEYVCCFCEYDLFFGSNASMEKGIRRRKKLLERKAKASEKAKGVLEGKGLGKLKRSGNDDKKAKPAVNNNSSLPASKTDAQYEGEEGCPGGDDCRCAEIRAEREKEVQLEARATVDAARAAHGSTAASAPITETLNDPEIPSTANALEIPSDDLESPPGDLWQKHDDPDWPFKYKYVGPTVDLSHIVEGYEGMDPDDTDPVGPLEALIQDEEGYEAGYAEGGDLSLVEEAIDDASQNLAKVEDEIDLDAVD